MIYFPCTLIPGVLVTESKSRVYLVWKLTTRVSHKDSYITFQWQLSILYQQTWVCEDVFKKTETCFNWQSISYMGAWKIWRGRDRGQWTISAAGLTVTKQIQKIIHSNCIVFSTCDILIYTIAWIKSHAQKNCLIPFYYYL